MLAILGLLWNAVELAAMLFEAISLLIDAADLCHWLRRKLGGH